MNGKQAIAILNALSGDKDTERRRDILMRAAASHADAATITLKKIQELKAAQISHDESQSKFNDREREVKAGESSLAEARVQHATWVKDTESALDGRAAELKIREDALVAAVAQLEKDKASLSDAQSALDMHSDALKNGQDELAKDRAEFEAEKARHMDWHSSNLDVIDRAKMMLGGAKA